MKKNTLCQRGCFFYFLKIHLQNEKTFRKMKRVGFITIIKIIKRAKTAKNVITIARDGIYILKSRRALSIVKAVIQISRIPLFIRTFCQGFQPLPKMFFVKVFLGERIILQRNMLMRVFIKLKKAEGKIFITGAQFKF